MKLLINALFLFLCLCLLFLVLGHYKNANSADWTASTKSEGYYFKIESCGNDCIQIETRNGPVRVYSCRKVDLGETEWREVHANEDLTDGSNVPVAMFDGMVIFSNGDVKHSYLNSAENYRDNGYHYDDGYWSYD